MLFRSVELDGVYFLEHGVAGRLPEPDVCHSARTGEDRRDLGGQQSQAGFLPDFLKGLLYEWIRP